MAKADSLVQDVEGTPGRLPPPYSLNVYRGWDGDEYGITLLLYGKERQFLGADIHLNQDDALIHELVHVLRRSDDHDRRYRGKVKYW